MESLSRWDAFRYVPEEFAVRTSRGGFMTIFTWCFMIFLLLCELHDYMVPTLKTVVAMDDNAEDTIEVYFDILMLELPCRFASVDLVDEFGEETTNVTTNIVKINKHWNHGELIEGDLHDDDEAMAELEKDSPEKVDRFAEVDAEGHHALLIPGDIDTFDETLKKHHLTFINFFSPWCHWCRRLEPIWEEAAKEFDSMKFSHTELDVKFASIDCEASSDLCAKYRVRAFPSLLMFKGIEPIFPFYDGERTREALDSYFAEAVYNYEDHMPNIHKNEACQIVGWLTLARVPGNFHIEAFSKSHDLSPTMANLSHTVNHLSFGLSIPPSIKKVLEKDHKFLTSPLDERSFIVKESNIGPQHFLKVVTVFLEGYPTFPFYEMTSQNRMTKYDETVVPEARFVFDFSPLSVTIKKENVRLYQFLTSILALIGGTFTVLQVLDGVLGTVAKKMK